MFLELGTFVTSVALGRQYRCRQCFCLKSSWGEHTLGGYGRFNCLLGAHDTPEIDPLAGSLMAAQLSLSILS